jgi:hypothetical protein
LEAVLDVFAYLKRHPAAAAIVFDNELPRVRENCFKKVDWTDIYGDVVEALPPNTPTSMVQQSNMTKTKPHRLIVITLSTTSQTLGIFVRLPSCCRLTGAGGVKFSVWFLAYGIRGSGYGN